MFLTSEWTMHANCLGSADTLFVEGAAQKQARQLCQGCGVRTECLAEALDNKIEWGVWGGMTERERRHLLRTRSDVGSWSALLLGASAGHGGRRERRTHRA